MATRAQASLKEHDDQEEIIGSFTVETEPAATEVIIRKKPKKKKKKKYRYTSSLKNVQKAERGASRSARRVADAVAESYDVYYKRRNKSARKRKDGALRDFPENMTYAMSRGLRTASRAPYDFVREINTNTLTRQGRDFMNGFFTFFQS